MSSSAEQSKEVVQRLYEAAGTGDVEALKTLLHEDFELEEPAAMPYGGTYRGVDGLLSALGQVAAVLDFSRLEVVGMVAEADDVVVTLYVGVQGSKERVRNAEHWTIRDGRVHHGVMYTFDPSAVLAQAPAEPDPPTDTARR